ncbi:hypothetical protein SSSM5_083 [Synechococcus phage S-SSM5]|uniref:Uncharacterized protein n=1 Tax=Synechococcus phage S-SSM5 TaxID=445685 RepID=E3SKC3_9CAUD|nr:hypothetical protein SSSM5_083 [Synechococcus phage S-SSM5]ADO97987.1 hypothetical protein SSSM5_083 [Synechococcus phage S-SSM5]
MSPLITPLARLLTVVNPCENTRTHVQRVLTDMPIMPYNNTVRVQKHS